MGRVCAAYLGVGQTRDGVEAVLVGEVMRSPTVLDRGSRMAFSRRFHVEVLRGGMNRLLLRALPTSVEPTRVEVFFQYVQHLDMPMTFDGLVVHDVTDIGTASPERRALLLRFPECRVFQLASGGATVGHIVAAACAFGEDSAPMGAESMFPLMD
jgi:hypothetical protein